MPRKSTSKSSAAKVETRERILRLRANFEKCPFCKRELSGPTEQCEHCGKEFWIAYPKAMSDEKALAMTRRRMLRESLGDWVRKQHVEELKGRKPNPELQARVRKLLADDPDVKNEAAYELLLDEVEIAAPPPVAPPPVALTNEDRYILTVLDAHRGKALTFRQIEVVSGQMNRDDPKKMRRLSDRIIRNRVKVLLRQGFVARPPGTKKKGVAITDSGSKALALADGNPPETRRKI